MPVNSKGRLRYQDFLNSFNMDKPATPLATGDSAKAQRGSSVPEVSDRGWSAGSSPTHDPKAGSKPRSHPCVSFFPSLGISLGPRSPQARDFVSPRVRVTEVSWNEPLGPGGSGEEPLVGPLSHLPWRGCNDLLVLISKLITINAAIMQQFSWCMSRRNLP